MQLSRFKDFGAIDHYNTVRPNILHSDKIARKVQNSLNVGPTYVTA